jgi:hypothetical protein
MADETQPSSTVMDLFKRGYEAVETLDYYLCAVIGAVFAYEMEHFSPHKMHWDLYLIEPVALVVLGFSFVFGIARLQAAALAATWNHKSEDAKQKISQLNMQIQWPTGHRFIDGQLLVRKELIDARDTLSKWVPILNKRMALADELATAALILRNIALLLGFVAIFAAKIAQPYAPGFVQQEGTIYRVQIVAPTQSTPSPIQGPLPQTKLQQGLETPEFLQGQPVSSLPSPSNGLMPAPKATIAPTNPPKTTNSP